MHLWFSSTFYRLSNMNFRNGRPIQGRRYDKFPVHLTDIQFVDVITRFICPEFMNTFDNT